MSANNLKTIRDFFSQQQTALCGMADILDEPWKAQFLSLRAQYKDVLDGLPADESAAAAWKPNANFESLYSSLCAANSLIAMLASKGTALAGTAKVTPEQIDAAVQGRIAEGKVILVTAMNSRVEEAIKERIKTGDLVAKETHTQLCSESKTNGVAEGEKKVRDEIAAKAATDKTIADRKTVLQTAGLPVPEAAYESILAGTDDEFVVRRTKAETRVQELKTAVSLNSKSPLLAKAWLPDAEYTSFLALARETLGGGRGGEAFAGGGGNGNGNGSEKVFIGCV